MSKTRLDTIIEERTRKMHELLKLSINPYPSKTTREQTIEEARQMMDQKVHIVGRIVSFRGHGKIHFGDIVDESGKIQLLFRRDQLADGYSQLKLLDVGDFIQIAGTVMKTQAGEITVDVTEYAIITKSMLPLPDSWHGLKDIEERYRKRYLDMLVNPVVMQSLKSRSKVIHAIRAQLEAKGFLEVETPTLQPIYGGGFARPFVTYHNSLDSNYYLRISDEMYLKRLIVGGFEKVYEITKVFRNEGVDHDHNPEFTMFEAMIAYQDYSYGMDLIEDIIENVAKQVFGKTAFDYQGTIIDVKRPWARYSMVDSIKKYTGIDVMVWKTLEQAKKEASMLKIPKEKLANLHKIQTIGETIAFVFEETVEEKLIQPTIIYDYPIEVSPLAKKCDDPRFTQRFEMFAFGSELGNNYTELNDPIDLRRRFVEEKNREKAGFDEAHQTDNDYLTAIEHGFPPTCGIAIGIDRLVMLLTNSVNIREVIAFPTLRPEPEEQVSISQISLNKQSVIAQIDPEVGARLHGMSFGVATITGVSIAKENKELELYKKDILKKLGALTTEHISGIESIQAYRNLFKSFGVDWHSRRPSPDALLRRIALGKGLYRVNTLVDAYNMAVLETNIGLGAFDASRLLLPVVLRFAKEGEKAHLLGDAEETMLKEGELVYADEKRIITVDLNYRDADYTKVTEKTKNILLFADGAPGIPQEKVMGGLEKAIELITRFCGGTVSGKSYIS